MLKKIKIMKIYITFCLVSCMCKEFSQVSAEVRYSLETRFIDLPVDHFSPKQVPRTFRLRYLINAVHHVKGGPVFVYTGNKDDISIHAQNSGFLFENAPTFKALLVFIEHRYYGQSLPFGKESFYTFENIKYLTTTQALADFVYVIEEIKKSFFQNITSSGKYPFIAFGGSYGGMMAAWLRMKYPYAVIGAIASSAPIYYLPGLTNCDLFYNKVTMVFQKYGHEKCIKIIKIGWEVITSLLKTKLGMEFISKTWKLCKPIKTPEDSEALLDWLANILVKLSMFNYHYPTDIYKPLPAYPVKVFCDKLTTSHFNNTKTLIEYYGLALSIYSNYTGISICNNIHARSEDFNQLAWDYQSCTEIIMPKCSVDTDIFITKPWDYKKFSQECHKKFGVNAIQPEWAVVAYGGKNVYYSNIAFSNGMLDPWAVGGVLWNLSDTVTSYNISEGPHVSELRNSDPADNNYVLEARLFIIKTLKKWLNML